MKKQFAFVEGPKGEDDPGKRLRLAIIYDGDSLEFLADRSSDLAVGKIFENVKARAGEGFNLAEALSRGFTYYKTEVGDLTPAIEEELRTQFPVSSSRSKGEM